MPVSGTQRIEEILKREGVYVSTTSGVSMYPMLRDRKDTIIVTPCKGRLKKHDVPLYRRGEEYVLHRILKVLPDSYIIRGDNCLQTERGITDADLVGVLTGFYRGGKQVDLNGLPYRAYVCFCRVSYPFRWMYYHAKSVCTGCLRKLRAFRR